MAFPEIQRLVKRLVMAGDNAPISLNLKSESIGPFNTVDAAYYAKNYPVIFSILSGGGSPSWSGETVSRATALNHSVVWACYRLVTESMGYLPASLKINKGDTKKNAEDHPMYSAMLNAPNAEMTAQTFKEIATGDCMLDGDGFAKIQRRSGTGVALGLDYLSPSQMIVSREKQTKQKRLVYEVLNEQGIKDATYTVDPSKPHDIFHLRGLSPDGVRGHNVVRMGRQSIGSALSNERNIAAFWQHGGRVPYLLQKAKFKDDTAYQAFRTEWERLMQDPHKVPILEGDTEYKQTGLSMVDAQAIESRQFNVSELTRWWGVSPHLVADLSKATFSNIEQLFLEFKTITCSRWAKRWEQEYWRCVLTAEEKSKGYFLKINVDALLRGDFTTRMLGYASGLQNAHLCVDEVRDLEDRDPLPNGAGKHFHIQTNMGTLGKDGQIQPAQQASSLVRLDS